MKNLLIIILFSTSVIAGCENAQKEESQKDKLTEKLEITEKRIDERIDDLAKKGKNLSDDALRDIDKTLKDLRKEKRKIKRMIKETASSSEEELKKIEKEYESIKGELDDAIRNFRRKVEEIKEESQN